MEWQPIETAPRDGTPVMVVSMKAGAPQPFIAHFAKDRRWNPDKAEWLIGASWPYNYLRTPSLEKAYSCLLGVLDNPTHWMPLPEPPTGEQ